MIELCDEKMKHPTLTCLVLGLLLYIENPQLGIIPDNVTEFTISKRMQGSPVTVVNKK